MNEGTQEVPVDSPDNAHTAFESGADGQSLHAHVERDVNLLHVVHKFYHEDTVFAKVLAHPEAHQHFWVRDHLIWTKNQMGRDVVCIPQRAFLKGRRLVEVIIDQAHSTIGHFGQFHTSHYIQRCGHLWALI